MRPCKTCGVPLALGENWSQGQRRASSYLCRACNSDKGKAWAKANPERVRETQNALRASKPGHSAKVLRAWGEANPEKLAERRERAKAASAARWGHRAVDVPPARGALLGPQSEEHKAKRVAAVRATLAATVRQCAKCSGDFTPTSAPQRYCSGQCWNAEARKGRARRHAIQVSPTLYRSLVERFGATCGICSAAAGTNGRGDRLAVDHCHTTGRIRGLLCHRCNTALGLLADSPDMLRNALAYLARDE